MIDETNPPITAKAMGARKLAPSPNPITIGMSARMVVRVVIRIGRIRCRAAVMIASCRPYPNFRSWVILSIRMMEAFTVIPANMIIPISAIIFMGRPKTKKVMNVPANDSGTESMIVNG